MTRATGESVEWPRRDEAFTALIGPRLDRAYGLAWHLLGHAADAEDACQEALLAAWSAWPRLRDPARFDAWFDRILVNTCIEHLRRQARRPQVDVARRTPTSQIETRSQGLSTGTPSGAPSVASPPSTVPSSSSASGPTSRPMRSRSGSGCQPGPCARACTTRSAPSAPSSKSDRTVR